MSGLPFNVPSTHCVPASELAGWPVDGVALLAVFGGGDGGNAHAASIAASVENKKRDLMFCMVMAGALSLAPEMSVDSAGCGVHQENT
jgi:hypothetical protein